MEQRANDVEVRIEESTGAITGLAAVFFRASNPGTEFDLFGDGTVSERVMDTAFDRALAEGDEVVALFNHDPNMVLGRTTAGTLELSKTRRGLAYSISPPDAQWARDLRESIKRGDVSRSSFQFAVPDDAEHQVWRQEKGRMVREIVSVDPLVDVSPVTFAAYKATKATAREELRALADRHWEEMTESSESSIRDMNRRQRMAQLMRLR